MYRPQRLSPRRRYSPSREFDDSRDNYDAGRRHNRNRDRDDNGDRDRDRERSPPRRYDDDRVPPPRRYDDERPNRYDDRGDWRDDRRYDDRDRDRYDDRRDRGRYDDRDAPRDRGHERHDRDREFGREPSSPSSRDVIFLGLDPELGETELAGFLRTEHHLAVESTKVVRDRNGQSKCFGFAMFSNLKEAERFVYDNFPTITMPALHSHSVGKRVKIDFAGSRGEREAPPAPEPYIPPVRGHDGTRDIGAPDGNQRVLLLRGIGPGTYSGEVVRRIQEEVARMLGKNVREAEGTVTRVAMIVDRGSEALWSFAFVELATPELTAALLPFLLNPQRQPNGFLISQVPVAASYANPAAFVPTPAGEFGAQFLLRAAPSGGIGSATLNDPHGEWCAYWHQDGGAVETVARNAPPLPPKGTPLVLPDATRSFLGPLAGVPAPALTTMPTTFAPIGFGAASSTDPAASAAGSVQPIKIGINLGGNKKKAPAAPTDGIIPISHKNVLGDDDEERDPGKDSVLLSRTKGAKIIPPTSTSRKIAKNINKWNTKQTELAQPAPPRPANAPPRGASSANATAVGMRPPPAAGATAGASASSSASADSAFDYTDTSTFATTGKGACLLCQRQFKDEEVLRKHIALSDLHKARIIVVYYLDHAAPCEAGRKRKEAAAGTASGTGTTSPAEPKYRDRAAERREVFHQPDRPNLPPPYRKGGNQSASGSGDGPSAPPGPPPPPPPAQAPAADETNVGNKLLAKMGWTAGSGLGASSDGRVDPIQVQQFDERVGLGAAKGREAGKWSGPGGRNERKKDMTRERYETSDKN